MWVDWMTCQLREYVPEQLGERVQERLGPQLRAGGSSTRELDHNHATTTDRGEHFKHLEMVKDIQAI